MQFMTNLLAKRTDAGSPISPNCVAF